MIANTKPYIRKELCTSKTSLLCRLTLGDSWVVFRNGSESVIDMTNIRRYCDPHLEINDDFIEYCILRTKFGNKLKKG